MSDVCLSVTYIGPKSRKERSRKTKIGTEVAHVTRDSFTTFKVKRSRSTGRFTHSGVNASGSCSGDWERIDRGNPLLRCGLQSLSARQSEPLQRPRREERGGGILWPATRLQLVLTTSSSDAEQITAFAP